MMHISHENDSFSNFTTILRILSGQDVEPEFVLVEHAYALPWSCGLEKSSSRPIKTLFFNKISQSDSYRNSNEGAYIDVELDSTSNSIPNLYDLQKGCVLARESERHVNAKLNLLGVYKNPDDSKEHDTEEEDWEEKVVKFGWSENQQNIFSSSANILNNHHLAKLSLQGTHNEPLKLRAQTDIAAGRFRQVLGKHRWDMKLCPWLHSILLHNLNKTYLALYIDILQTLNSQIPTLVEKLIALPSNYKGPVIEDLNLFFKKPWDPVAQSFYQFKPSKLDAPIIIQVPSGLPCQIIPQISRRFRFFNTQLQNLVKFVSVAVSSDLTKPDDILNFIASETRTKIVECKAQHPSRPVILLGWGVGASLAANISLIEKVSGIICLGFPLVDHEGIRGDGEDPLLDLTTPALFVIGSKATNADVDSFEHFRYQLSSPSSLITIDGADSLLRISSQKCYNENISQSIVDRCIVDEIGTFLKQTLDDDDNNNKPTAVTTSFINPLPPRGLRKELCRKRKFSTSESQPTKMGRPTESRLSHNLGLKIPIAVSSTSKADKQDITTTGSFTGLELPIDPDSRKLCSSVMDTSQLGFQTLESAVSKSNSQFEGTCSSPSLTTISLGSLASLSRQKYQRMMQMSESSDHSSQAWKSPSIASSETPDSINLPSMTTTTTSLTLANRANVSTTSIKHNLTCETTDFITQPVVNFHPSSGKASNILVTSSVCNPTTKTKKQPGRRGRPPGRNNRDKINAIPLGIAASKKFGKHKRNLAGKSSMAVLTLTGEGESGGESTDKGISSLGRGVLTLSRGGTSAVRVYSANNHSNAASTATPAGAPKNSLHFTNIASKPSDKMLTYQVSNKIGNSNSATVRSLSTPYPSPAGMQGISASRAAVLSQRGSAVVSRTVATTKPTTMVYFSNSAVSTGSPSTTMTTISSGGVKTTKSIVGARHANQEQFNVITVEGSNTIHIPETVAETEEPQSELDILAAAATELYAKRVILPSDELPSVADTPSSVPQEPIRTNLKVVNTKPMMKYISSTQKRSAIKIISSSAKQPLGGRTFLKTAAVGRTSSGKVITRTFTINPNNMEFSPSTINKRVNLDIASEDKSCNTEEPKPDISLNIVPPKIVISTTTSSSGTATEVRPLVRVSTSIGADKSLMSNLTGVNENSTVASQTGPLVKVAALSSSIKLNPIIKVATNSSPAVRFVSATSSSSKLFSPKVTENKKSSPTDTIKVTVSEGPTNVVISQATSNVGDTFSPKPLIKVSTNASVAKAIVAKPSVKVSTPRTPAVRASKDTDGNATPVRGISIGRRSLVDQFSVRNLKTVQEDE